MEIPRLDFTLSYKLHLSLHLALDSRPFLIPRPLSPPPQISHRLPLHPASSSLEKPKVSPPAHPPLHPFPYTGRHFITGSITPRTGLSTFGWIRTISSPDPPTPLCFTACLRSSVIITRVPAVSYFATMVIAAFVQSRLRSTTLAYGLNMNGCVYACVTGGAGCLE